MIGAHRVLAIIPARGGSKGVPRKNLRLLGGKPLLKWTVDAARASRYIDRLVLSTDSDEIAALGRTLGLDVPFGRSAKASSDEALARDVIEDALAKLDETFEYLVYLQPTSPFRSTEDIDGCLEAVQATSAPFGISLRPSVDRPEWTMIIKPNGLIQSRDASFDVSPRQDLREAFVLNGAVYVGNVAAYLKSRTFLTEETVGYVMPEERSLDLDSEFEFTLAEAMLAANLVGK
jgi:N-acylneuraminate cytidylyltransferase